MQWNEPTSIADAQGISSTDAGTTREGTLASRLHPNLYLAEVHGQCGRHPPTFSSTRDSQVFSFLAGAQQGGSLEDKTISVAGTSLVAGLGVQTSMGAHASQGVQPPQVLGCVPLLRGEGNAEVQNIGNGADVPVQAISHSELAM